MPTPIKEEKRLARVRRLFLIEELLVVKE